MRHGRGELDMAHAVAPHLRQGDLDAAFLADDPAILHPLVLAAQALVILDRTKDAGAEQPVPLRLEGTVVDRFGLLDLAIGPGADALRAGDRDADLVEALRPRNLPEDVHQLIHRGPLSNKPFAKPGFAGRRGGEAALLTLLLLAKYRPSKPSAAPARNCDRPGRSPRRPWCGRRRRPI